MKDREQVSGLMLELLIWVSHRSRTYGDTMDAWRSTCPRHTVWEDALIDGFVQVENGEVTLTDRGRALLNLTDRSTSTTSTTPPHVFDTH
jgi:hypothetical protein